MVILELIFGIYPFKAIKSNNSFRSVNIGRCSFEEQRPMLALRCTVYSALPRLKCSFSAAARALCI